MPIDYTDEDLLARWEELFETSENRLRLMEVAGRYPELRSIAMSYNELDKFDPDMAVYLLDNPYRTLGLGEQAAKKVAAQGSRSDMDIHIRIKDIPRDNRIEIRLLRSEHLGKLISVEGLVRKATEVRPRITKARFKCYRCPAIIEEPQDGLFFKEPLECYKDQNGCGRTAGSTKFTLLAEESEYVDTQKIEIQESPEGLRGGAQPERLTGFLEDDLAGKISPGDRISLNGVLRSVQKGAQVKSTLFDINLDILAVESKEQEYEEVEITEEDEVRILNEARSEDIFEKIVKSISPTIKGYDEVKESIALQLFGGSSKKLDDGTKVRGDIHILLVGDPGVAKCVTGDAMVMLADGSCRDIKGIVEEHLAKGPVLEVDDGVYAEMRLDIMTYQEMGVVGPGVAVKVWKRDAPRKLIKLTTVSGRSITVTPTHPLFVPQGPWIAMRPASKIFVGQCIAVTEGQGRCGPDETIGRLRGMDWDNVALIEKVDAPEPWVYDLEVEGTHIFVANGILNHNSQMLRYMSHLAPRGIYASGKSSSAAGLCVAPDSMIDIDGDEVRIQDFVEDRMTSPVEIEHGEWRQEVLVNGVKTLNETGGFEYLPVTSVFRLATPSFLVEILSSQGTKLKLTPETRLYSKMGGKETWVRSKDLMVEDEVMTSLRGGVPGWSKIVKKRLVYRDLPEHVYDLTVEGAHCFFANGFLVHNTAAAVKDEFGEGRWTLEAGALVLADKGVACIEENQYVLTEHGMRMIRDLKPGDVVLNDKNGLSRGVIKHVIPKGIKPTVKVRLYSGDVVQCTEDHPFLTRAGWKQAKDLTKKDQLKVPTDSFDGLKNQRRFEDGFIHGFALCDISYSLENPKPELSFTSSPKNDERSSYVIELLAKRYGIQVGKYKRDAQDLIVKGHLAKFGPNTNYYFHDRKLRDDLNKIFHEDAVDLSDKDYCFGFIAAILSTDCCISHKQGTHGSKHIIEIGIGRKKWGPDWTSRKMRLICAMFLMFGIQAVMRRRKVMIMSLNSYNKAARLFSSYIVGMNKGKLFEVEPRTKIVSYDDLLDDDYCSWLKNIKFDTSATVRLGLHSRIYLATHKKRVSVTLMETLRPKWKEITIESFREPIKGYVLNPVLDVEKSSDASVYDLTIDGEPNFYVSGAIVHNCVDELDKMTDQDRSSMHEAMESSSISVAKAGITATLQCRTSVLGAANPKYGRFDENEPLANQINMPPALLSRFDLIFALLDKPNQEKDAKIAEHIIKGHTRGQVIRQGDMAQDPNINYQEIMAETEDLKPYFQPEFMRKYVKYAKKIIPVLTKEAQRLILDTYLSIRKQGEGPNASVPITARQLEAIIRLSEASARIRLSRVVAKEDAQRAVRIVRYYLEKMAKDSGSMDVDKLMTGTPRSERNKISIVRRLIQDSSDHFKGAPEHVVAQRAEEKGITEAELKDILRKMKQAGEVYDPGGGHIKLVSGD